MFTIGAAVITYTILGVPYSIYKGPQTRILIMKAPIVGGLKLFGVWGPRRVRVQGSCELLPKKGAEFRSCWPAPQSVLKKGLMFKGTRESD